MEPGRYLRKRFQRPATVKFLPRFLNVYVRVRPDWFGQGVRADQDHGVVPRHQLRHEGFEHGEVAAREGGEHAQDGRGAGARH